MIFQWSIIATEADEDLSKLSTDLTILQNSSSEEIIKRGLGNGIKLCSQILQKVQQADIEREQAMIQLLFKEKELIELKKKLEVSKQTSKFTFIPHANASSINEILDALANFTPRVGNRCKMCFIRFGKFTFSNFRHLLHFHAFQAIPHI